MPNQLQFELGGNEPTGHPLRRELRDGVAALAQHGIHLGTSSWKYPGWRGLLYDESKYSWRGKFSENRFNRECLAEYAEVFKTVCVDAAFYQFPTERYLTGLAEQVPSDFLFSFKVTDEITALRFPNIPRSGERAGHDNPNFLNADLFAERFLSACDFIRDNVGLLIFEFTRFRKHDFASSTEFCERLDRFLGQLPGGWDYGVELRNEEFLDAPYLATLKRHRVAHVYNSWDAMPSIEDQMKQIGDKLDGLNAAARLLLKPGRRYQDAVDRFSPYNELKEPNENVRDAVARLINRAQKLGTKLKVYGNNRLEGNALMTIAAILKRLERSKDSS